MIASFQQVELFIWGSQVAILSHLNGRIAGDSRSNIKQGFYDPSVARFPELYGNYSFELYIAFLERNGLVIPEGEMLKITPVGQEYLAWRIEARRPPTLAG